jgi:hypothetical protein
MTPDPHLRTPPAAMVIGWPRPKPPRQRQPGVPTPARAWPRPRTWSIHLPALPTLPVLRPRVSRVARGL